MQESHIRIRRLPNRFDYSTVAGVELSNDNRWTRTIVKNDIDNLSIAKLQYKTYQSDLEVP